MSDDQDAAEEAVADQVWGRAGVDSYPEAAAFLRRVIETRANEYGAEDTADECRVMFDAVRVLEGNVDTLRAILPSWRWPEFGVELDVRVFPPQEG